jgi:diguanylate cyclase (GGDEF)-like protein/PAS domain S-box-containing protein
MHLIFHSTVSSQPSNAGAGANGARHMRREYVVDAIVFALLVATYFAAGKLGQSLTLTNLNATAVWPPTGLALAASLLLGYRVWFAVLVGAFLVNVTVSGSVVAAIAMAVGNTLEATVGAYLINRFANGKRAFEQARDTFNFATLGGIAATAVGASVGTIGLALATQAEWSDFARSWLTWWLSHAVGALVVAPVLILWTMNPAIRWRPQRATEYMLLLLTSVFLSLAIFAGSLMFRARNYPLELSILLMVVWAAYRLGPRAAATVVVAISSIAIGGTLHGRGPFVSDAPNESLLLLQVFIAVVAITGLTVAALVAERQRSDDLLRWLATIVESSDDAIVGKALDGTILSWNKAAERIYGYAASEAIGRSASMLNSPDRSDEVALLLGRIRQGEHIQYYETERIRKDGRRITVSLTISPIKDARGAILGASAIARDISNQKRAEKRIRHMAQHDPLTGLPNRVLLYDRIGRALAQAQRNRGMMAVLFLDLDDFKDINDSFGHQTGDRVLRMASHRLLRCLRAADSIGRLGGDEFVICLPDLTAADDAALVARKILEALRQPFVVDEHWLHVSGSIGISIYPKDGINTDGVMRTADLAMYNAKAMGRGNYRFFEPREAGPD